MGRESSTSSGLPQGTVTFVFTDIEGSTQRAETVGDETWAELLTTHRRLLRDAFAQGGHVVDTEGDAFFVAFASAAEAVCAATSAAIRRGVVETRGAR